MTKRRRSIFVYKLINSSKPIEEIKKRINEELNRNLAFTISQKDEQVVFLTGKWMGWATANSQEDKIYLYVNDSFFQPSLIIEQILTSLWANLLDFGEIRLEDFDLSDKIHDFLSQGHLRRAQLNDLAKMEGPFFGTIFKPSYGLSLSQKIEIAKRFADVGGTFIKEDETYFVKKEKLLKEAKKIQNAMSSISDRCFYIPNITSYFHDKSFLQNLYEVGIRVAMINYLITGLPSIYKIKNDNFLLWGHRVGYETIKRFISMKVVGKLAAYTGFSFLHVGTPIFEDKETIRRTSEIIESIKKVNNSVIPVFTKCSVEIVYDLVKRFGKNIAIMACGSIRKNEELDWEKIKKFMEMVNDVK